MGSPRQRQRRRKRLRRRARCEPWRARGVQGRRCRDKISLISMRLSQCSHGPTPQPGSAVRAVFSAPARPSGGNSKIISATRGIGAPRGENGFNASEEKSTPSTSCAGSRSALPRQRVQQPRQPGGSVHRRVRRATTSARGLVRITGRFQPTGHRGKVTVGSKRGPLL